MTSIQITSNVIVHYDHDLKRFFSLAEDTRDGSFWKFYAHKEGVLATKLNQHGASLSWPKVWNKWTIHERTRDDSPWPESTQVAMLEAMDGFPCLKETAEIAWEVAMA